MTCELSAVGACLFILYSRCACTLRTPALMQKPFFAAGKWLDRKGKLCDFAKNNINVAFLGSIMDKVAFPYRSSSHLILMHVVAESGAWEKHGLQVDYDYKIGSQDAQAGIESGDLEFCGGNHVSTYGLRARGSKWVYLGQTVNNVYHSLVVRPGLRHQQRQGYSRQEAGRRRLASDPEQLALSEAARARSGPRRLRIGLPGRIQARHHGSAASRKRSCRRFGIGCATASWTRLSSACRRVSSPRKPG